METIGTRIKKIRNMYSMNQATFAVKLNLSIDDVSAMEEGRRELYPYQLRDICLVYGVHREWLEKGIGEMMLNSSDITENRFKFYMQPFITSCMDEAIDILNNDKEYQEENAALDTLIKEVSSTGTVEDIDDIISQANAVTAIENQMMFILGLKYGIQFAKMLGIKGDNSDPLYMRSFVL